MTPLKGHQHLEPYYLINTYLKQSHPEKIEQLKHLLHLKPNIHCIMAGDFNFVESASDAPSPNSEILATDELEKAWLDVTAHLGLFEIPQPVHTRYALSDNPNHSRSSRIDRIYINHTLSDLTIINPIAYPPTFPSVSSIATHGPTQESISTPTTSPSSSTSIQFIKPNTTNAPTSTVN